MAATFTLGRFKPSGQILNILDVSISNRNHFICIECGRAIVCVLDVPEQTKHFRHKKDHSKCKPSLETLLHKTAKEIICEHDVIHLPEGRGTFSYKGEPEYAFGKYRADVALHGTEKKILVEVVVSHGMTEQKHHDYHHMGADCMVINLQDYKKTFHIPDLTQELIKGTDRKRYYGCLDNYFKPAEANRSTEKENQEPTLQNFVTALAILGGAYFGGKWIIKKIDKFRRKRRW